MAAERVALLYEKHIKHLPVSERLKLVALVTRDLAAQVGTSAPRHSVLELRGLGKEIWAGADAQSYVDRLRDEWDAPAMTSLDVALRDVTSLGLDTSPVIYFIEEHSRYASVVNPIFERIASGRLQAITSVITLGEVLVQPYSSQNQRLQADYRDLLLNSDNLQTLPIEASTAVLAAELRARYRLRMPDALQIAISLEAGCEAFLTNDVQIKRVGEIRVLLLDDLLP